MEQIEKIKISHIEVHRMICDKCGSEMTPSYDQSGNVVVLTTNPPQYAYVCQNCGNHENSEKLFPYTEFMFGDVIE